jgi:PAS domain S-box-containing protein
VGGEPPSVPQSESELPEFFDLALDLMAITGFDGYFKRVNPAYERALGYPRGELLTRPFVETVHPEDLRSVRDRFGELVAADSDDATGFEYRAICRDGSVRWLQWNTRTVPERGVIFAVGRDVTDRRRADAELREAQRMVEVSRDELARLAEEQAALRRVATLVARGAPPEEVFAAVANEVGRLLSVELANVIRYESDGTAMFVASAGERVPVGSRWPLGETNLATLVFETGRPARIDDYAEATGPLADEIREEGVRTAVGTPIIVEGRLWGLIAAGSSQDQPLPPDTEARLASFTELVAAAIANTEARTEVGRLVDEQAALRRVATLVAEGAAPSEVFQTVTREVGILCGADLARMERYESGDSVIFVAGWSRGDVPGLAVGKRFSLEGASIAAMVREASRPARVDSVADARGPIAREAQALGIRSSVGCPIVVEGRLWGVIAASTTSATPFAPDTESQIAEFTELVATAIANTESHATANRLTEEQAALRRVATLVAKEAPPAEVFAKVAEELANVLGDVDCSLFRDEGDGTASAVALSGARVSAGVEVGTRLPVDGDGVIASVLREGRPCRIGEYSAARGAIAERGRELGIRSAVGCPIVVGDRIWGAMGAARYEAEAFPPETESSIGQFADLVATAIANADARAEVERLAEEQAALRRVATLVAAGAPPEDAFAAVANEVRRLLLVELANLCRYEPDGTFTVVAGTGAPPVGSRWPRVGENVTTLVFETGRSVRIDSYAGATGPAADEMHRLGVRKEGMRSAVGTPVIVEGKLWGMLGVGTTLEQPLPPDAEARLTSFTELVATAIANAEARTEVAASRARIVAAIDEERRRVVRDLHDGAQQRLVHTIITLKLAQRAAPNHEDAPALLSEALDHAERANVELRELAHGILPAALTRGGLRTAVDALASRSPVPVETDVLAGRLPAAVEATAYFIVAEALTNVAKHAHARHAEVTARIEDGTVAVQVRDDGRGGAQPDGSGLLGLADRVAALDGELQVESPADGGTRLAATIPLPR